MKMEDVLIVDWYVHVHVHVYMLTTIYYMPLLVIFRKSSRVYTTITRTVSYMYMYMYTYMYMYIYMYMCMCMY